MGSPKIAHCSMSYEPSVLPGNRGLWVRNSAKIHPIAKEALTRWKLTPDIDLIRVVAATKDQLWRSVVARHDVGCVKSLRRHDFRTSEVANLDYALFVA